MENLVQVMARRVVSHRCLPFLYFILVASPGRKSSFSTPSLARKCNLTGCKMKSCVPGVVLFGMSDLRLRYCTSEDFYVLLVGLGRDFFLGGGEVVVSSPSSSVLAVVRCAFSFSFVEGCFVHCLFIFRPSGLGFVYVWDIMISSVWCVESGCLIAGVLSIATG